MTDTSDRVRNVRIQPLLRISAGDLDSLIHALDVRFIELARCQIQRGYCLNFEDLAFPRICYCLRGKGKLMVDQEIGIVLEPHTMVVIPAHRALRVEAPSDRPHVKPITVSAPRGDASLLGATHYSAGGSPADLELISGNFSATYGSSTDLFGSLSLPIIESFDPIEEVDRRLNRAIVELTSEEIGSGAMSAALLKEVIVTLLRRSLKSFNVWVERFALLSDQQIARAFAEMVAHPGADHTVASLAQSAALSRSAFMARFVEMIGSSPMLVLRDLRMRIAARQLSANTYSIDQIAHNVGYRSRSSFVRAFKKAFGEDPSDYREATSVGKSHTTLLS